MRSQFFIEIVTRVQWEGRGAHVFSTLFSIIHYSLQFLPISNENVCRSRIGKGGSVTLHPLFFQIRFICPCWRGGRGVLHPGWFVCQILAPSWHRFGSLPPISRTANFAPWKSRFPPKFALKSRFPAEKGTKSRVPARPPPPADILWSETWISPGDKHGYDSDIA